MSYIWHICIYSTQLWQISSFDELLKSWELQHCILLQQYDRGLVQLNAKIYTFLHWRVLHKIQQSVERLVGKLASKWRKQLGSTEACQIFQQSFSENTETIFFCAVCYSSVHSNIERNKAKSTLTPKFLLLTWNYWPTSGSELEINNEDKTKFPWLQQHHKTPDFWLKHRWLHHMKRIFVFYLLRKKKPLFSQTERNFLWSYHSL